jgi:hypothetical protein
MATKAFIPPPIGDQDHILRRLGWAVVRHWSSLPGNVQADLWEQALFTQDGDTVQSFEELATFIEKHKGPPTPRGPKSGAAEAKSSESAKG